MHKKNDYLKKHKNKEKELQRQIKEHLLINQELSISQDNDAVHIEESNSIVSQDKDNSTIGEVRNK